MKEFRRENVGNIYGVDIYCDFYSDKEIGFYIMRLYDENNKISQGSALAELNSDKNHIKKRVVKKFRELFTIVSKQILKNIEFQVESK